VCLTCHRAHGTTVAAGGTGPQGEALQLEVAYLNGELNGTAGRSEADRSPVTGYFWNRTVSGEVYGVILGFSSVLSRFATLAESCFRCHAGVRP
jgi:cytochrome c553